MDLISKYIGEGRKSKKIKYIPGRDLFYVKVIEKKSGNVISTMDSSKFLSTMEREFKKFKFLDDAIDFYNKHYKDYEAKKEINR